MKRILCLLHVLLLPIVGSQLLQFRPNAVSFTANAGRERQLECRYLGTFTGSLSLIGPATGSDRAEISGNGVTGYVLTIRDVQISDAGAYTCYHTSGEEVEAELIVIDDPEFLDVPLEQSLIEGSDAVVQCPAYLGHPPATLQWFKDNSEILGTLGSRFSVESDGLHIENVGMQDRGEYRCLLERQGWGIQFRDITVDVQPASPCIDKSEHPLVEVLYNEVVAIDCMLMMGCAAAEVWWVKPNGAVVREQTLHLEAPHTPGIYSCFARNDNGDDRYDVTLDIRVPPLPPTSERTVLFHEGQTIMLSADLDMAPNPVPSHLWRSAEGNSIPVQEPQREQRVYVTAEGRLVIRDVTVEDAGIYHCTVQNQHGMSVQSVTLLDQVMAKLLGSLRGEGDLRLIGGESRCEGRLQLSKVDPSPATNTLIWSTACHRNFSTEEIRVTCRQLGCPTGDPSRVNINRFGGRSPSPHDYTAFGFTCSGQESKVVNCPYTGAFCDIRDEKGNNDIIGILCNEGDEPTPPPSDPPRKLRLAGGPYSCIGRLEVYVPFLGQWAQAVYRNFGPEEVQVVCRELGCDDQGKRISVSGASEPYLQVGYNCTGNEYLLEECEPVAAFSQSDNDSIGLRCGAPQECPLDHLPVRYNQGELEACLPCSVGSTRINQNDTKCIRCKLQYFPVEGRLRCRVCPPGSKRPDQSQAHCVCGLPYQPVTQNNTLVRCVRCPAGSSRLSQDDLNCTCDLRFYPVMQSGKLLECHPCPVGSSRLNHTVSECTCQLQLYPIPSPEDGMLQECHPCPSNSARMDPADSMCTCNGNTVTTIGNRYTINDTETCTICPLEYTISKAGLHSVCEPCPPGSRRQSHADENCTCDHSLEYYPVMQNGIMQACNHCPPGSSRLSLSATECTCYLDYYNSTTQNSNGLSQGSQCNRCSPGSLRPHHDATECKCQQNLLSHIYSNFTLWCLHCPMNSEKITPDDRECTCLRDAVTINESSTTIFDACSGPPVTRKPASDFKTTLIAGTTITACMMIVMLVIVIACIIRLKWRSTPKVFTEEVDLNFHPVSTSVSRSLAVSESITTELCNLDFEERRCELTQAVNRGTCSSNVRECDQEIINKNLLSDSELRLGNKLVSQVDASEDYGKDTSSVENNPNKPLEVGCLASNNQACSHYEHAGNPSSQGYKPAGSTYDQAQRYELAGSAYNQTQRYELACSAYDQTQRYELACSAYDQIQSYEQLDSDYSQIQGYEQRSASPSDHACTDADVTGSSSTSISAGDGNKHTDNDTNETINRQVRSKEQTEPDADVRKETTNSHSHREDSDTCEQVQEASSCGDDDQVQSYEQIVSSYGQVQSYQQAHSAYDVIQDYSQVPYYEQTSNPYDQTQDYETVCAYESFHGRPVDSDAV